jgi:hypothetical protein
MSEKVLSKTEEFKVALQAKVLEVTGQKVSKQAAWNLFKAFTKAPYEQILKTYNEAGRRPITYGAKLEELVLPLSGVGSFRIITVGNAENTNVKPRFYISSSVEREIQLELGFSAEEVNAEDTEACDEVITEAPANTAAEDFGVEVDDFDI